MPNSYSLESPRPRRWGLLLGWAFLALLALGLFLTWRIVENTKSDAFSLARDVAAKFDHAFNFTPEVRVNSTVVVAASKPAFELVTMQKQALVRRHWSETWLHSTKSFTAEATFTARAGFDLSKSFHISVSQPGGKVTVKLPPPQLLSISMGDIRIDKDEDGLWNKLTPQDREQAFRDLEVQAREKFAKTPLLEEARMEAEKRIASILSGSGDIRFTSPPKNQD